MLAVTTAVAVEVAEAVTWMELVIVAVIFLELFVDTLTVSLYEKGNWANSELIEDAMSVSVQ